jgi:hypothetical protein
MKKILFVLGLLTAVATMSLAPVSLVKVSAASGTDVFQGPCKSGGASSTVCKDKAPALSDPNNPNASNNPLIGTNGILMKIVRIIALVAGVAAVIMLIINGLSMITSSGDTQKFSKARDGFIFALVGLVIIVLAQYIISFVVSRALK